MSDSFIPAKLLGIIGHPLGHTMSPTVHNWALREHGLDAVYMAWPTPPEKLADFMTAVRTLPITGVSVTIPHKEKVRQHLDGVTERARMVGAVNTLYWDQDQLVGDNTDMAGFMRPLRDRNAKPESALVLGAGGAARAVLAGLVELGVKDVLVANRTRERAEILARDFPAQVVDWEERTKADVQCLINTTPMGMSGAMREETSWPKAYFRKGQLAYDLVYNPLRTRFIQEAGEAGCETIPGLAMFTGQAAEQFRLWTGKDLDVRAAADICAAALKA